MANEADKRWLAHETSQMRAAHNMKLLQLRRLLEDAQQALVIACRRNDGKGIDAAQRRILSALDVIGSPNS